MPSFIFVHCVSFTKCQCLPVRCLSQNKRHTQTTTKYVELIVVADNREISRTEAQRHVVSIPLLSIPQFYRALNIRVALVGLEVWSDVDKCPITQDPFTTLHEFLDWRKVKLLPQKPHDNAQLISGVYFQGTTIGMAPIMSMCTADQSGGIVMDHSDNPLGAAVTLAHELGHNFGMNHDTPERGCGCRGFYCIACHVFLERRVVLLEAQGDYAERLLTKSILK
uniref:ADAM metallopeptidase domain 12 n=1 Tax=Cynoglossus semilaevis TaxID=244447 RepID=A0A3P8VMM9_CYNSE